MPMKEIKTIKPLTGNPKIDKYLLTSTPLRTLIDGIPLKWRLLWDTGIEADKLYELMVSYYEEKEFIDDYTFASNLIEKELKLDYYLHSKDAGIRRNVAKKGYGLNVLVNDPNTLVRITIAKNGWCLDRLKHDKSTDVRLQVVKQNYDLEFFLNDTSQRVAKEARKRLEHKRRKQLIAERKAQDENN